MKKQLFTIAMALTMISGLSACKDTTPEATTAAPVTSAETTEPATTAPATDATTATEKDPETTEATKALPAQPLTITKQPENIRCAFGENIEISIEATGEGPLVYQWQYRKNEESSWYPSAHNGAGTSAVHLTVDDNWDGCDFRCYIKDATGQTLYSDISHLSVLVARITPEDFPDENFRRFILENIDLNQDGCLSKAEISNRKYLFLYDMSIRDLTGIEYFVALEDLDCSRNQLTSLDVSSLTKLDTLNCSNNQLTTLDVSRNPKLIELSCSENKLSALDVSHNPDLLSLSCFGNPLQELDVQNCDLMYLDVEEGLNVSGAPDASGLSIHRHITTEMYSADQPDLLLLEEDAYTFEGCSKVTAENNYLIFEGPFVLSLREEEPELYLHFDRERTMIPFQEGATVMVSGGTADDEFYNLDQVSEDYLYYGPYVLFVLKKGVISAVYISS